MARSRASASYTITASDRTRAGVVSARQSLRSLDTVVSKLGVNFSIMSSLAAAAPLGIVAANAPVIDSYGKLSEKLGIAVENVQGFIDASERAGIAQNTLFTSLQRGIRRVSEAANGFGEARGSLDELGLSAKELAELRPEDRILAILDAIQKLNDEGDQTRIASKIFDSEGVDLIRLSGDAVRDATKEMVGMNRALTELDVQAVETMNDELQLLQSYGRSAAQIFTAELAPAITGLSRLFIDSADSMDGLRDASRLATDASVSAIGIVGTLVQLKTSVFDKATGKVRELGAEAGAALRNKILGDTDGDDLIDLDGLKNGLEGISKILLGGEETFFTTYKNEVKEARDEAEEFEKQIKENRRLLLERLTANSSAGGQNTLGDNQANEAAQKIATEFQGVATSLETEAEKIESIYQNRLSVIDAFARAYPAKIEEANAAELRALDARYDALDELEARRIEDEQQRRDAELAPLETNFDQIRNQFATETEILIEETNKRVALLQELGQLDADRKAEADALIVQLEEQKQAKLTQITREQELSRLSQQTEFASQSLGVLSSLINNTEAAGDRSKKIAARLAQGEALVAGISAAERARNHASLTGGLISGGLAAGLSWASTLANVAGIEAALQGGTPGGPSGGGSVPAADESTIRNLESGNDAAQPMEIKFYIDPTLVDSQAFEGMVVSSAANASRSRNLVINVEDGTLVNNDEQ